MSATLREIRVQGTLMVALVGLLFLHPGRETTALPVALVTWFLTCVMVESLWHPALRGRAVISMAPAAHLAALVALPITWGTPLVMAATAAGAILWRRHDPGRALLRGASAGLGAVIVVALLSSTHTFALDGFVGGPQDLLNHPRQFLAFVIGGFLYLAVTQGVEVFVVSRELNVSLGSAWRQSYGRETELVTSVALVTVAFLVLFCYHAIGYRGLLLCVMPLLFVRDGSRRNLELAQAQSQLIENERLAAKGEMAAEIGHELNNYLAAISGRAQLLLRKLGPEADREIQEQATLVHRTSGRMAELAKGLMDFSHRDVKRTAFGINELVDRTVEFIRPQTRFRALTFAFSPAEDLPRWRWIRGRSSRCC